MSGDEIVTRFDIPADILPRPVHEVQYGFASEKRARVDARRVNELGTDAGHELRARGQAPGFLEQEVTGQFCPAVHLNRRHAELELEPILERRHFRRDGGTPMLRSLSKRVRGGDPDFQYHGVVVVSREIGLPLLAPGAWRIEDAEDREPGECPLDHGSRQRRNVRRTERTKGCVYTMNVV